MSKKAVKIGVRIVDRPTLSKPAPNQPYQPPKKQYFKAIATCNIAGKRFSRTAAAETEEGSRREAYSKLATLIAKQGAVPVEKYGVEISPSKQDNGQDASES
tara:strand:+ start:1633 stop:1938 length:306 start_codon:yes stop_codon:yes gene_type:complete